VGGRGDPWRKTQELDGIRGGRPIVRNLVSCRVPSDLTLRAVSSRKPAKDDTIAIKNGITGKDCYLAIWKLSRPSFQERQSQLAGILSGQLHPSNRIPLCLSSVVLIGMQEGEALYIHSPSKPRSSGRRRRATG